MSKKIISVLMCAVVLISTLLPVFAVEVMASDEEITIIACSDFQPQSGIEEGENTVNSILSVIRSNGVTSADGFLCAGDYDCHSYGNFDKTKAGIQSLKNSLDGMVDEENMVFVQGNHDAAVGSGAGLSPSGDNDPESGEYGVFVIHNEDYMWANKDEARIKQTGQKLINYLNEKLAENFDRPIFVISHLPLHYSMRTRNDGDGKYAGYLFNALNEAGEKGLNIVFMYGHDHSNGWDDYIGGAAVCLKKGDDILVADFSSSKYSYKTLNFTYLNPGFVGYYSNHNGADDTLTMTVFKIKGDTLTVSRYDGDGVHPMKSAGVRNSYKNESGYDPDTTVYSSPQSVSLTKVDDASPIEDLIEIPDSGKQFNRITSVSQLKDGGRYLLVCSTQANKIVPPVVVKKANSSGSERIGFDILNESVYVDDSVFGDYEKHLWTFTKSGNGWSIGDGEKFAAFTSTSNYKITATLEEDGEVFTVAGNDSFTFTSGKYCLNYNARGLINGYEGEPAGFCIFEYVGHSIKVKNGSAYVNGISVTAARGGETVTVKADAAPDGKRFDEWRLLEGDLEISNSRDEEISFVMPDGGVKLVAAYKDNVRGDANGDGRVTNADALAIYRYIFNPRIYPVDTEVSDLNADGIVTVLDILIIFRHIFDPTLPL